MRVLLQGLLDNAADIFWVNNNYQPSDALTKLSSAGARIDLLVLVAKGSRYRISFCDRSGRKELQEMQVEEHQGTLAGPDDDDVADLLPQFLRTEQYYVGDHDEDE